jgi:diketogulonate reductase-like aldo/keto reductase
VAQPGQHDVVLASREHVHPCVEIALRRHRAAAAPVAPHRKHASVAFTKETSTRMLTRTIPGSGEALPLIGLGTYQAFDVGAAAAERAQLADVLQTLVARGGRLVDSSPMYGRAESVVGALQTQLDLRAQLFLATKVWTSGRDAGMRQMERSFQSLRAETIDLMQIHNLVDVHTHTDTLEQWKRQGKVRYLGITHYHEGAYDELARLLATRRYDFVQLNYSLAERAAEQRLLPLARETGVAVIANRPFAQGALFHRVRGKPLPPWATEIDCSSWGQFFLKYVVSHPAVICVIPATSKPEHMLGNALAGAGRLPDDPMRVRMVRYLADL